MSHHHGDDAELLDRPRVEEVADNVFAYVERLVGNLHPAMFELGGAEPGAPIDLVAAIPDMIAYNGGGPLRCLA